MQSHEMLFDAQYHAFVAFGGVPERAIYDNMNPLWAGLGAVRPVR